jgi:hypothetical protein
VPIECMLRRIYLKARQNRFFLSSNVLERDNMECEDKYELECTGSACHSCG